jgi:CrcB protein
MKMAFLLVFLGAGIGGMARHAINSAALKLLGSGFPYATLAINVAGSLLMGLVAEYWAIKTNLPQPVRLFLTTGVLGGFTTFSAFSLDTVLLWERGQTIAAAGYVLASVALSVGALLLAIWLVRHSLATG